MAEAGLFARRSEPNSDVSEIAEATPREQKQLKKARVDIETSPSF